MIWSVSCCHSCYSYFKTEVLHRCLSLAHCALRSQSNYPKKECAFFMALLRYNSTSRVAVRIFLYGSITPAPPLPPLLYSLSLFLSLYAGTSQPPHTHIHADRQTDRHTHKHTLRRDHTHSFSSSPSLLTLPSPRESHHTKSKACILKQHTRDVGAILSVMPGGTAPSFGIQRHAGDKTLSVCPVRVAQWRPAAGRCASFAL